MLLDVCSMEIDEGPCRGSKPFYAFNSETKRCQKFLYGGKVNNTENLKIQDLKKRKFQRKTIKSKI